MQNLSSTHLPPNAEVLAKLAELGTAPIRSGMSLLDLLRRSEMTYEKLTTLTPFAPALTSAGAAGSSCRAGRDFCQV